MRLSFEHQRWFAWLLLLALTACQIAPSVPSPTPLVTITFMVFGDPGELAAYQTLVERFHARQTGIRVELIHIPGQGDYRQRLTADLAAGTPADVVLINYRRVAGLAAKGALTPLDKYLAKSTVIHPDDFYPIAYKAFFWEGQPMCVPQNISSLVVYYNKNLFDAARVPYPAPEWTWDDFLQTALALTRDRDGDGRMDEFGAGLEPTLMRLAPFLWQNGGYPVSADRLGLIAPRSLQAVQWFVDLQVAHHVVPNAEEEQSEDSESRFLNGRAAMYFNSRRVVPTLRAITAFDWDVAALPRQQAPANILHADGYCLPAASRVKDAAWAFIEFANSVEGQTLVAATGRTVPSLRAVAESPAFLDPAAKPAHSQVFLDTIPVIRTFPRLPTWADIEEVADSEIERAFYGQVSVSEAMESAYLRTRPFFSEDE